MGYYQRVINKRKQPKKPTIIKITDAADKLLSEYDYCIDERLIDGTGKNFSITKKDVQKYIKVHGIEKTEYTTSEEGIQAEDETAPADVVGEDE